VSSLICSRFKVDVNIAEGTHASEAAVNKQLADKVKENCNFIFRRSNCKSKYQKCLRPQFFGNNFNNFRPLTLAMTWKYNSLFFLGTRGCCTRKFSPSRSCQPMPLRKRRARILNSKKIVSKCHYNKKNSNLTVYFV
jgi:hypothetical protein